MFRFDFQNRYLISISKMDVWIPFLKSILEFGFRNRYLKSIFLVSISKIDVENSISKIDFQNRYSNSRLNFENRCLKSIFKIDIFRFNFRNRCSDSIFKVDISIPFSTSILGFGFGNRYF